MGNIKTKCEKSLDNLQDKFKTKVNKYFELPLIDIDTDMLDIPVTEYTVDMEIHSNTIIRFRIVSAHDETCFENTKFH